jgi:hypothetical protein
MKVLATIVFLSFSLVSNAQIPDTLLKAQLKIAGEELQLSQKKGSASLLMGMGLVGLGVVISTRQQNTDPTMGYVAIGTGVVSSIVLQLQAQKHKGLAGKALAIIANGGITINKIKKEK